MKLNRILAALLALCMLAGATALADGSGALFDHGALMDWYDDHLYEYNSSYFGSAFDNSFVDENFRLRLYETYDDGEFYVNDEDFIRIEIRNGRSIDAWFDIDATYGEQAQVFFVMSVIGLLARDGRSAGDFLRWSIPDGELYRLGHFSCEAFDCEISEDGDFFGLGESWWIKYHIE